ncbi:MAG TPA: M35 family metallo-endopeptidase [Anaerolineales bacterium]|nr:M35 family metallo-endopeptidase [Anaerolineales bacterium]
MVQYRVSSKDLYGINIEGDLISNELSLEVSGRIDPLLKIIQPEIVSGNTTFNACSASQQTALLTARADASTYAETAKNYLVNNRAGALYQLWFGVYDIARYNKAKSHFNLISNAIDTVTVNFDCTCTDPFYAYVYPSSPYNIYLCNSFWSASATGTDSKAGTLIHEMSHFIVLGGTDDYIYGKNGAKSLAISNPANAVMNADNHEYFAENTPPTADNAAAYTLNEISYNFGIQASGSSSISHTFTLTSTGDVNLAIGQLAVTTEFILIDDLCSNNSIGMGNACTFKISFAPSSTGIKNGTVTIPSNSIIENNISLSGIGTVSTSVTISGSTGASGVALSYMDGTPKTVTSDANGNYSFTVPVGWSGTVTPAHSCYTFNPASRNYSNLSTTQTNQNYTSTFTAANGCVNTSVEISATNQGNYGLAPGSSLRKSYTGVDNGPVKVDGNGGNVIAAERVIYYAGGVPTSFTEMMGLPSTQIDDEYWFPWYDNVNIDTNLRFGNVSGAPASVQVFIGGVEMPGSPFALTASGAGQSLRVSFAGVNNGPVHIVSTQPIVAAERIIYNPTGSLPTSFSEMMGLPASQVNTTFVFPWYNNLFLDTQLRFANVSGSTATVNVYIGGTLMPGSPFTLPASGAGQSKLISFAGIDSGPVRIVSNQPIVASERTIYNPGTGNTSFTEMMGLPESLVNTTYYFPWYNNLFLDTQLRFGNVSGVPASVRVYIGGVEMAGSPFALTASGTGQSLRISFAGIDNGPVKIVSDQPIVAAEREIYLIGGVPVSFTEMMGLPNSLLNSSYWFPWYNNLYLDTQLRFGAP